jgi:hypothetical protein
MAIGGEEVFAIIAREAQQQRSQQGQPQQSPRSGAQGSQPQSRTNQPSPSQQQGDELAHRNSALPQKGHSRAIVPCQSRKTHRESDGGAVKATSQHNARCLDAAFRDAMMRQERPLDLDWRWFGNKGYFRANACRKYPL